jgi:hypothetical protein
LKIKKDEKNETLYNLRKHMRGSRYGGASVAIPENIPGNI